jgi:membrane associated rhomboid family serine protease
MSERDSPNQPNEEVGFRARRPYLTWLVCTACVLLTVAFHISLRHYGPRWEKIEHLGYQPLPAIWNGSYRGMFTAVFVHGSPSSLGITAVHLGFNLLWLYGLGCVLEDTLSRWQWGLFFCASAVIASGAEIALSSQTAIGASGVIYSMFGLMWAGRRQVPLWREVATRSHMLQLIGWGLFFVVATVFLRWHVANAAHAGGFLFGLAAGWLFVAKRRRVVSAFILAALVALTVMSATWMPWSGSWTEWKGQQEAQHRHYNTAIYWFTRSLRLGNDPARMVFLIDYLERKRDAEEFEAWLRTHEYPGGSPLFALPPGYVPPGMRNR